MNIVNIESVKTSVKSCFSFCKERAIKLADKRIVKVAAILFAFFAAAWVTYEVRRGIIKKRHANDQNKPKVPDIVMEGVENSLKDKGNLNEDVQKDEFQENLPHDQEKGEITGEVKSKPADEDVDQGEFPDGESEKDELYEDDIDHFQLIDKWKLTYKNEDIYTDQLKEGLSDGQGDLSHVDKKNALKKPVEERLPNGKVKLPQVHEKPVLKKPLEEIPPTDQGKPPQIDEKHVLEQPLEGSPPTDQDELPQVDEKDALELPLVENPPITEGNITDEDGNVYQGQLEKGQPYGQGKLTYNSESYYKDYTGEFKEGKPHGRGKMIYKRGEVYTGQFKDGQPEGEGKLVDRKGNIYVFHV